MIEGNGQSQDLEALKKSVVGITIEAWRFGKLFDRLLSKLDAGEQGRYVNQFRYFQKKMDEALADFDMRVVNVEGHIYDPGLAATPLNVDEFEPEDALYVDQMLEPIIMGPKGVVKMGTVTLRRAAK